MRRFISAMGASILLSSLAACVDPVDPAEAQTVREKPRFAVDFIDDKGRWQDSGQSVYRITDRKTGDVYISFNGSDLVKVAP